MLLHALLVSGAHSTQPVGTHVLAMFWVSDERGLEEELSFRLRAGLPGWDPGPFQWRAAEAPVASADRVSFPFLGPVAMDLPVALGFGDGTHPTTRVCARELAARIRPGDDILDLGAGSGILSVLSLALGARRVEAVERDLPACRSLEALAIREDLAIGVHAIELTPEQLGPLSPLSHSEPWDGIVANVACAPLLPLMPALLRALATKGWLIVSGVVEPERPLLDQALDAARGLAVGDSPSQGPPRGFSWTHEAGWWTGIHHPALRDGPD